MRPCFFAFLLTPAATGLASAASAPKAAITLPPSFRLEAVETAPLWAGGVRGTVGVRVVNRTDAARRCIVRLRVRNDADRVAWTLRTAFPATPGTSVHWFKLKDALPLGPYEVAAALDKAAPALKPGEKPKPAAPRPFEAEVSGAFAVVDREAKAAAAVGTSTLTALLSDGRARDIPSWLRSAGLPLASPSPEGDTRFTDERDRRMERKLRRDARIENIFIARDNLRFEGNGDARFMSEAAARTAWAQGETVSLPVALDWPADVTLSAVQRDDFVTSAQALRSLMAARHFGTLRDFAVVLPQEAPVEPTRAGNDVLARTATALAAGTARVLLPVDDTATFDRAAARRIASLAAWTALTDNALYESGLFGGSPLLRGASFRSGRGHLALVWLERNSNSNARLVVGMDGEVFDRWGNPLAPRKGSCVVPLGNGPVWVKSRARDWKNVWQSASLENTRLLAAQVLPLRRDPRGTNDKTLDVRLQNTGLAPVAGMLSLSPPPGWSLVEDETAYRLAAGEAKTFRFKVAVARPNAADEYPVGVEATRGKTTWTWKQTARVATAGETDRPPLIDAELSEWLSANWMHVGTIPVAARVALRWDATRIYIAAVVTEPQVASEAAAQDFWRRDAIQLAFGLRDEASSRPGSVPFRDTDYGFVMLPWRDGEARLLRGWNPAMPFDGWNGRVRDRERWGGVVPGAKVAVRRDQTRGVTLYEASLPVSEMPKLRPVRRANDDVAVRFAFQVHSGEAPALSWARANNVFAWWGNPVSFIGGVAPAAQVPLGFSLLPARELQELPPAAPPRPRPKPVPVIPTPPIIDPDARRAPETGAPQRKRRRPTPPREKPPTDAPLPPDDFKPPTIEPMSPHTLPPAETPPGTPLPPAPVAKE